MSFSWREAEPPQGTLTPVFRVLCLVRTDTRVEKLRDSDRGQPGGRGPESPPEVLGCARSRHTCRCSRRGVDA